MNRPLAGLKDSTVGCGGGDHDHNDNIKLTGES